MLYITFTSSSQLYWELTSCKDLSLEESNFPSLSNHFIWTLGRNSSTWSQVDVAVVNGKYFPGEVASRVGNRRMLDRNTSCPTFIKAYFARWSAGKLKVLKEEV